MEYVIETETLTKTFGNKTALRDVNLSIPQGGIHAIVGNNGAGKTTLFRILLGLETATSGSCSLLGEDCRDLPTEIRGRVGYVNDAHTLPQWLTVNEVTELQKASFSNWNQSLFDEIISNFNVESTQNIKSLSRGEQAGAFLALTLAQSPEVLLLDEPALGLDVVAKQAFLESLLGLEDLDKRTILYCSHQMEEIERVADKLIILEDGEIIANTTPDTLCHSISTWTATFAAPPDIDAIPGLLSAKDLSSHWKINVQDQGDRFKDYLTSIGGGDINKQTVGLEEALRAVLTKNHKKSTIVNGGDHV